MNLVQNLLLLIEAAKKRGAMEPSKIYKTKTGRLYVFEREPFTALLTMGFFDNAGLSVPEVVVKIYQDLDRDLKNIRSLKPILVKSVFLSKRDAEKMFGVGFARVKKIPPEDRTEKFREYLKLQYEKYKKQMNQIFNAAEKEITEKEKFVTKQAGIVPSDLKDQVLNFLKNPTEPNVEILLADMKDKKFVRPIMRGPNKGMLTADVKAANRVLHDEKLLNTPQAISALITKAIADHLDPWTPFGWQLAMFGMPISWWVDNMVKLFGMDKSEVRSLNKLATEAITFYSTHIVKEIRKFNQKLADKQKPATPTSPPIPIASPELEIVADSLGPRIDGGDLEMFEN